MKIEFTKKELEILESCEKGKIDCPAGETAEIIGNLLERALSYEKEVKPEEEPEDLLHWYYEQYKDQHFK